jgi:hypothetical protein
MKDPKKIAAALAAVAQYLQVEQDALSMAAAPQTAPTASPLPAAMPAPWGLNGRLSQMQMRNLMQMRAFQGNKRF